MLYIHPDECVDCGACEPVCPVEAIYYEDDVPDQWKDYTKANVDFFDELGSPAARPRWARRPLTRSGSRTCRPSHTTSDPPASGLPVGHAGRRRRPRSRASGRRRRPVGRHPGRPGACRHPGGADRRRVDPRLPHHARHARAARRPPSARCPGGTACRRARTPSCRRSARRSWSPGCRRCSASARRPRRDPARSRTRPTRWACGWRGRRCCVRTAPWRPARAKPALVWLNSPSNPTGRVLPVEHLRKVVEWAGRAARSWCPTSAT